MTTSRVVILLVLAISGLGCGGSDPQKEAPVFEFRLHGMDNAESFRIKIHSSETITAARAQLSLPEEERRLFPIGGISPGNGGVNLQWSWHLSDVRLTEVSIELCDGTPSLVEADLYYWTNTVTHFCPWQAYVYAEIDQADEQSQ